MRLFLRAAVMSVGLDPEDVTQDDAMLLTRLLMTAKRIPTLLEFFELRRRRGGRFRQETRGRGVRTSEASTAEDFELMVRSGWARRA